MPDLSRSPSTRRVLAHAHLVRLDYAEYLELVERWRAERLAGYLPDLLITTSHPPVVTLGRDAAGDEDELRVPVTELAGQGVAVFRVGRGGRATYHGPGQLMVYPVVHLGQLELGPADFVELLLDATRQALKAAGLVRNCAVDRGLWIGPRKLASVGLAVSDGVAVHGLALNVEPEPGLGFGAVYVCGEPDAQTVDLQTVTGRRLDRETLSRAVAESVAGVLGLEAVPIAREELYGSKPAWLVGRATAEGGAEAPEPAAGRAAGRPEGLLTVCAEADCPNQARCAAAGRVTYLLLGPSCTRACRFCRVSGEGYPAPPDPGEPERVARAVAADLGGLTGRPGDARARSRRRRVVLSSVTRDDLPDGGAAQFAATVRAIRRLAPGLEVEVMVPDFRGKPGALETVLAARPDVVGHNLETVPRLYPLVRPGADYRESLELIGRAAAAGVPVRSGLLLGLGEDDDEVLRVARDLAAAGCRRLWLGQYLRPTAAHHPVARYVAPMEFERLARRARRLGFEEVTAGPLVRSSCSA